MPDPRYAVPLVSPLIGRVNVFNILAASAAAYSRGCPAEAIADGIAKLARVPGRFERVDLFAQLGRIGAVRLQRERALEAREGVIVAPEAGELLAALDPQVGSARDETYGLVPGGHGVRAAPQAASSPVPFARQSHAS